MSVLTLKGDKSNPITNRFAGEVRALDPLSTGYVDAVYRLDQSRQRREAMAGEIISEISNSLGRFTFADDDLFAKLDAAARSVIAGRTM